MPMPFTATPLAVGDAFDIASRIAAESDAELAQCAGPAEEAACLARHWGRIAELGWMGYFDVVD